MHTFLISFILILEILTRTDQAELFTSKEDIEEFKGKCLISLMATRCRVRNDLGLRLINKDLYDIDKVNTCDNLIKSN